MIALYHAIIAVIYALIALHYFMNLKNKATLRRRLVSPQDSPF
jgi:predicted ferric reductase